MKNILIHGLFLCYMRVVYEILSCSGFVSHIPAKRLFLLEFPINSLLISNPARQTKILSPPIRVSG